MSEKLTDDLLPCPFCGGKADWHNIGNRHTRTRSTKIWCSGCMFSKNVKAIRHSLEWTKEYAFAAWNRRQTADGKTDERLRGALEKARDAFRRYGLDVDTDAPSHHVEMMREIDAALSTPAADCFRHLTKDSKELAEIRAMLSDEQGADEAAQILPDFEPGWSTSAKVEACLHLLEKRRDALTAGGVEAALDALVGSRDVMSRAADLLEHAGRREDAERVRRQADECRGVLAVMLSAVASVGRDPSDQSPAMPLPINLG